MSDWDSYFDETAQLEQLAYPTFSNLPSYARDPYVDEFGDVGQFAGGTAAGSGGGTEAADQAYRTSPGSASATGLDKFLNTLKGMGGKAMNFAGTPQGIMTLLAALAAYKDRAKPSGGGTTMGMMAPRQFTRTMTQGQYGPIARYAAEGGLMQAYAQGGKVFPMQDGGFVMTKRAVDGAGGIDGLKERVPEAVPIRGPGTGTSDSIPAYIEGKHGNTPAKVSNGEAYVPPGRNTKGLYALMHHLERKA